ncbi:prepilin-type N-terminal cleavage/methylation domain-containing protein [Deinococcus taeanensis]|uniref:type II secretion system protein n=1 Tax=Deinococcus taeanensis TaxID=2737050 RepID=UPI001CDB704C|nr:prepilin-type N-terminal cleavage/methylation domain-containing protein [Deinococcus taeanensis]UBV43561.1 prepilin-type N-terminal cleavage/methylation domain-containing protein [Deinococcus taeanensis]
MIHPNRTQGVTLIELLVAMAILGIIVSTVLAIIPRLYQVNRTNVQAQLASTYARTVMESVRSHWLVPVYPIPTSGDLYPNFTSGTLPSPLPTAPSGLTCAAPTVTAEGTASPVGRRTISVTCTSNSNTTQKFTFVGQFGRPE